jgi:prolipoprotein diacylglyceryltransferase
MDWHSVGLAAGALVGHFLLTWRAGRVGLDPRRAAGFSASVLVSAVLVGHWAFLLLLQEPVSWQVWLMPFAGAMTLGCLGGALVGGLVYLWRYDLWRVDLFEAGAWTFPFAWIVVRLGCWWNGEELVRWEVLWAAGLAGVYWWARGRRSQFAAGLLVSYGVLRLVLHEWRTVQHATDWWGAVAVAGLGLVAGAWQWARRRG